MTAGAFTIRPAVRADVPLLLKLIKSLADYEKLLNEVVATEELLTEWLFDTPRAEVLIVEYDGVPIGYALYFHNFSTFLGRSGIYIEDLYIKREFRGRGYGKALLRHITALALVRGCGRVEWSCLDWNEPSIKFYLSLGAQPTTGWTMYRLTGEALEGLAGGE